MKYHNLGIQRLEELIVEPSIDIVRNKFSPQCQHKLLQIVAQKQFLVEIAQN